MLDMAGAASGIFAPVFAGALIAPIGVVGILTIDIVSAGAAIGTLLFSYIPQPPKTEEGKAGGGGFLKEAAYGFKYIFSRPSLLGLQSVFMVGNLFSALGFAVMAPMLLARSGGDEWVFASVQTAGAIGGVVGGLVMAAWGGFKRNVHGVLIGWFVFGVFGMAVLGFGQTLVIWIIGNFIGAFFGPMINGSNQSIWQAKVAPDVQGRVFATRRLIAWLVSPFSQLVAGPLADNVFEPAMATKGTLASIFGGLVGTGPGSGMGVMFLVFGILAGLTGLAGYLFPAVRDAEEILPDHKAVIQTEAG
jgi:hypothetical protein